MYKNKVTMNKEIIKNSVSEFLSARYSKQIDKTEEEQKHFFNLLAECAEYVMQKMYHPATEIPKHGEHIVTMLETGVVTSWYVTKDIAEIFEKFKVKYWAYSSDMLPGKEDAV